MELLQLRYFVALAESENLTKTANSLYISPSSLSLTISKLEREVGVKLFDRVGRKLRLNDSGREFLRHLRSVLSELDSAVGQLQQKNSLSLLTDSPNAWLSFLSSFAASHPDIQVNSRVARKKTIVRDMMLGEFDFWLSVGKPIDAPDVFETFSLTVPSLYLAVPEGNPLAQTGIRSFDELQNERFLFPYPGSALYRAYTALCEENGLVPNIVRHASFLDRLECISSGEGVCFVDESVKESDLFKRIVFLPLPCRLPQLSCHVHRRRDRKLSGAARTFLDALSNYYREM